MPLKDGITDDSFQSHTTSLPAEFSSVVQTQTLSGDELGCLHLTMHGQLSTYAKKTYLSAETLRGHEPPVRQLNMEDMNVKDGSLEHVRINVLEHLNSAPSVGMHDVLRESLLAHLGFGKEGDTQDKLDERLAQHTRFVHKLRESDTSSSSSDDEPWDSDERRRRRQKQRTSLLTGQYFDVAHNHQSRRKFFQSRVVFDDTWQGVRSLGWDVG